MIDPLGSEHVAGGDRMDCRQIARLTRAIESLAQGLQHGIRTAKAAGGIDRDNRAVPDQGHGFGS